MAAKAEVIAIIRERLLQHAATCRLEMEQAQASANSEEKSSAGDKYETGREMGQQQRDFYAKRLDSALLELKALNVFAESIATGIVQAGSLIQSEAGCLFVGIGVGIITLSSGEKVICTSPDSPLGKSLAGKKEGDSFLFAGRTSRIAKIC